MICVFHGEGYLKSIRSPILLGLMSLRQQRKRGHNFQSVEAVSRFQANPSVSPMMAYRQQQPFNEQHFSQRNTSPRRVPNLMDRLPQGPPLYFAPSQPSREEQLVRSMISARIRAAQQAQELQTLLQARRAAAAAAAVSPMAPQRHSFRDNSPTQGLALLRSVSMSIEPESPAPRSMPPAPFPADFPRSLPLVSPQQASEAPARLYIDETREWDVLCGRGGRSNHHSGNKRYRHVVSEMKAMYRTTDAKNLKTDLSRAIVEHVCNYGGRFIKKDEKVGRYYVLTKAEARKKTSQALRETKELKWTL